MVSRAYFQCIHMIMSFFLIVGMTSSAVGEFRSHSFSTKNIIVNYDHAHTHNHEIDHEDSLYHDSGNHSHDKANVKSFVPSFLARLMGIKNNSQVLGAPVYSPFKIERPPKTPLFV